MANWVRVTLVSDERAHVSNQVVVETLIEWYESNRESHDSKDHEDDITKKRRH